MQRSRKSDVHGIQLIMEASLCLAILGAFVAKFQAFSPLVAGERYTVFYHPRAFPDQGWDRFRQTLVCLWVE